MAKPPTPKLEAAATPDDFAQTTPDLYSMTDIRVVMREQGALGARVEGLTDAIEKLGERLEKAQDRHTADLKERICELKADLKETDAKAVDLQNKVSFVKGVMWVLGGLFALALVLLGAIAGKIFS